MKELNETLVKLTDSIIKSNKLKLSGLKLTEVVRHSGTDICQTKASYLGPLDSVDIIFTTYLVFGIESIALVDNLTEDDGLDTLAQVQAYLDYKYDVTLGEYPSVADILSLELE